MNKTNAGACYGDESKSVISTTENGRLGGRCDTRKDTLITGAVVNANTA